MLPLGIGCGSLRILDTQNEDGVLIDDDQIDGGLFIKHVMAMAAYVKASKLGQP